MAKLRIFIAGFISLMIIGVVSAAELTSTPTNLAASDSTFLRNTITSTQTTITLEPLNKYINAVKTEGCIDTASGFALIGNREYISFGNTSCDSTTHVTTLTNIRRGLSPSVISFTGGTGFAWDAGTSFRVVDYPIVYNNSLYKDIVNYISGSIRGTSTGSSTFRLNSVTTTQRDAFTSVQDGDIIYNDTSDVIEARLGGGWSILGGSGVVNATEHAAGKSELATLSEQGSQTATGSTGAPLVIQAKNTIKQPIVYTGSQIQCGSGATSIVATWAGISNGSFTVSIDGTERDITGIDFTGDATMQDVASTIQSAIRSVTSSSETVFWTGNGTQTGFTVISANTTSTASMSLLSAQGAGTDLSGAGGTAYMDCDIGSPNEVTITDPYLNHPADESKVALVNSNGFVDVRIGGTGSGSFTQSGVLISQGTGAFKTVQPGSANNVLLSNGSSWVSSAIPQGPVDPVFVSATSSTTLTNPTSETDFDVHTFDIPANDLINGVVYQFVVVIQVVHGTSGTFYASVDLDGNATIEKTTDASTGTEYLRIEGEIMGTTTPSASSAVRSAGYVIKGKESHTEVVYDTINLDTTQALTVNFEGSFGTSNAGNNATILMSHFTRMTSN